MEQIRENFLLSDSKERLQIDRIHRFLSNKAYWCLGIPLVTIKKAIENSLCFGIYDGNVQVAFARIITDKATFAWLCDVYVEEGYRGKNLSKWMMENIIRHPDLQGLRRLCLATKDAHSLYTQFGFQITETPQNWMEIKNNNIYRETSHDD